MLPKATGPPKVLHSSIQSRALQKAITPRGPHSSCFILQTKSMLTRNWESAPAKDELIPQSHDWFQAFPFWQFHALFNSLFKVLFIFPSRYLFAIGLSPVFSLGWYLPPFLVCIPKQTDSLSTYHIETHLDQRRDSHPLWCLVPKNLCLGRPRKRLLKLQFAQGTCEILNLSSSRFTRRY